MGLCTRSELVSVEPKKLGLTPSNELSTLIKVSLQRYHESWQLDDVEQRIRLLHDALSGADNAEPASQPVPSRSWLLFQLCQALEDRFAHLGQLSDAQERVRVCEEALALVPEGHPEHAYALLVLGSALRMRFELSTVVVDIERAVELHTKVFAMEKTELRRGIVAYELGWSYLELYLHDSMLENLEQANSLLRDACDSFSVDDSILPAARYRLAVAMNALSQKRNDAAPVEEAVKLHQENLRLLPAKHRDYHMSYHGMGVALFNLFRLTSEGRHLLASRSYFLEALKLRPPGHPVRALTLNNLAAIASTLYRQSGAPDDLAESIRLYEELLEMRPPGHQHRGISFLNLSVVVSDRYAALGDKDDLEHAIMYAREAIPLIPQLLQRALVLNNLGSLLKSRYDLLEDADDIAEAIACHRSALDLTQPGDSTRAIGMSSMAGLLILRFEETSQPEDIEEAISVIKACEEDGIEHHLRSNLADVRGLAYKTRYLKLSRHTEDLDKSIDSLREALSGRPEGHWLRFKSLTSLANALSLRYKEQGNAADYDEALRFCNEAADALPVGHPHRAETLVTLANIYLLSKGPHFNVALALDLCVDAVFDQCRDARFRFTESMQILDKLEDLDSELGFSRDIRLRILDLYRHVIALIPRVAYFGLHVRSRLHALAKAERLARSAAAYALSLDMPKVAVEALEEGRAVFWSQSLRLRTQFDALPTELANKMKIAARELEQGSNTSRPVSQDKAALDKEMAHLRHLGESFEQLVAEARALPGFERFLLSETYESLAFAANCGPVVILVPCPYESWAIIMSPTEAYPKYISLPSASATRLKQLSDSLGKANGVSRSVDTGQRRDEARLALMKQGSIEMSVERAEKEALSVLEQLWEAVMEPVVQALDLRHADGKRRPRVWICPTGVFTFLPVHAAGFYEGPKLDCCSDYFVASYTPTIKALQHSREHMRPILRQEAKMLLAGVPNPFQWSKLPRIVDEILAVRQVVDAEAVIPLPPDTDCAVDASFGASVQTVLENVEKATILHLACHGYQNHTDVLESGFIMQDKMLTLSSLMGLNLPNGFLAVLSACETAKGDSAQPDQTVHLAATMLFCGFKSVVATLWSMHDVDGPVVVREIYEALFNTSSETLDPDRIAYALDEAVRKLRLQGLHPSRWAPYVHIGV